MKHLSQIALAVALCAGLSCYGRQYTGPESPVAALTSPAARETASDYQGAAAERFLAEARITSVRPIGIGVTRPMRVTLDLGGVTRLAVFRSIDIRKAGVTTFPDGTSDVDFQDSWLTEIAAYRLDRLIGLGLVPATVERRVEGRVGSLRRRGAILALAARLVAERGEAAVLYD